MRRPFKVFRTKQEDEQRDGNFALGHTMLWTIIKMWQQLEICWPSGGLLLLQTQNIEHSNIIGL